MSYISPEIDPLHWWKAHESALPQWAKATRKVSLMQSSSAAAEHVFSLLLTHFQVVKTLHWKTMSNTL